VAKKAEDTGMCVVSANRRLWPDSREKSSSTVVLSSRSLRRKLLLGAGSMASWVAAAVCTMRSLRRVRKKIILSEV
jgi:hypothetical protein